jgi:MoaA/NifB/PqqE/SkfB family radical SAM enzyme
MPREKPPVHGSGFRDRLALTFMPGVLDKVRRNFRDIDYAQALVRAFDDRPLQCSLYVTDQCNLDCSYCTEYDNSVPHPSLAQLERWVRKIRELGTERIALVGGEPLMHPDIVALVRFCKRLGMSTSLTTNGFLLTRELVAQLAEAGLDVMQISIDRVTPSPVTKKSLKTVERKVALLKDSPIKLHLTGVICGDTLDECEQVLAFGLSRDIPTEIRLVHAGPDGLMRVDPGARERARAILERMIEQKQRGEKIHTTRALLDYQLGLLEGRDMTQEWVCAAGYKLFFVSARGKFYECSMRHTERDLLDMTLADLAPYHARKACQNGCGVYCVVGVSLFRDNPAKYVAGEVVPRLRQTWNDVRGKASAQTPFELLASVAEPLRRKLPILGQRGQREP